MMRVLGSTGEKTILVTRWDSAVRAHRPDEPDDSRGEERPGDDAAADGDGHRGKSSPSRSERLRQVGRPHRRGLAAHDDA